MTPAEHYTRAQDLLEDAADGYHRTREERTLDAILAQAHATLATATDAHRQVWTQPPGQGPTTAATRRY